MDKESSLVEAKKGRRISEEDVELDHEEEESLDLRIEFEEDIEDEQEKEEGEEEEEEEEDDDDDDEDFYKDLELLPQVISWSDPVTGKTNHGVQTIDVLRSTDGKRYEFHLCPICLKRWTLDKIHQMRFSESYKEGLSKKWDMNPESAYLEGSTSRMKDMQWENLDED